ncbi:MAG: LacI family DNA-binding transcriptional regulator [Verrucomicrobia bacterium]|nr:LacI family DNA-binding transcriptional regulator [Verrucomicrobiota bacterium]
MEPRRVTQLDVARKAGVHRATVSMALRNHPNIPPRTRDRILAIVKKLGYAPDPMLSALASYRSRVRAATYHGTFAWLTNSAFGFDWRDRRVRPHFTDYFEGARRRAALYGFQIETFDLHTSQMTPARLAAVLRARSIGGVLLCPQPRPDTTMAFPWAEFSVVTFGYTLAEPRLHTITAAQYRAMLQTMRELRQLGYRRIGLALHQEHDQRTDHNYLAGYLVEQQLSGAAALPPLTTPYDDTASLRHWWREHRPDAIVTGNYRLLEALRAIGVRPPRDVGVACPVLPSSATDLAGVIENSLHIGEVAVDVLVPMIQRGERGVPASPHRVHVEGLWLPGKTVRPQR